MIHEGDKMPTPHAPSAGVRRALRKLGADIHDARRRRLLTLQRVESGDPSVGVGIYAAVLLALGLLDGLQHVADVSNDKVGQSLATAALP
jgi:hypothetical protein